MSDVRSRRPFAGGLGRANPLGGLVLGVALLAVGCTAWWFAAAAQVQPEHILPPPGRVLEALSDHWPNLSTAMIVTIRTVGFATLIGLAIAAPVCIALGALAMAMPGFGRALRFLAIWIGDSSALLIVTLLPTFVIWVGIGEGTRIRAAATGAALAFAAAMLGALTANGVAGLAQAVLRGLRHAIMLALLLVVVSDMVAGRDGLGHMILAAMSMLNVALMMAATLMVWIVGLLVAVVLLIAEWAVARAVERAT